MSRYTLDGINPNLSIVVGWDRTFRTYFAQVWDGGRLEAGNLLLRVGAGQKRVTSVSDLVDLLEPYADFPDEIASDLGYEQWDQCGRPATFKHLLRR